MIIIFKTKNKREVLALQVWIEIFAQHAVNVIDLYETKMKVTYNNKDIEESYSTDRYNFFGTILGGKRIAAIGREKEYTGEDLFRIFEADVSNPIEFMFIDPQDDIKLNINTNMWLDPGILVQDILLKIYTEKKVLEIPLQRSDIELDWLSRGNFAVDIGDFIREFNAARINVV